MANKVPISTENIAFERLDLTRHYLTIDCDFTVYLVLNSSGVVPAEGTDICILHTGSWQIDTWSFLTKKDFPNQAGFTAHLVWDKTLVRDGYNAPQAMESDIDTANSVSSLKGQPVNIIGFSMPQGETLPVSIWRNSLEMDDNNPLPSSLIINGLSASSANPVPSSMQIGTQPVSSANPVPSSMQIGTQPVSSANPVPVNMIFDGTAVTSQNPLAVSAGPDFAAFSKGGSFPFKVFLQIGARQVMTSGDVFTWCCSPTSYFLSVSDAEWVTSKSGFIIHKSAGNPECSRYYEVQSRLELFWNSQSGVLENLRFIGYGMGLDPDGSTPVYPFDLYGNYAMIMHR